MYTVISSHLVHSLGCSFLHEVEKSSQVIVDEVK